MSGDLNLLGAITARGGSTAAPTSEWVAVRTTIAAGGDAGARRAELTAGQPATMKIAMTPVGSQGFILTSKAQLELVADSDMLTIQPSRTSITLVAPASFDATLLIANGFAGEIAVVPWIVDGATRIELQDQKWVLVAGTPAGAAAATKTEQVKALALDSALPPELAKIEVHRDAQGLRVRATSQKTRNTGWIDVKDLEHSIGDVLLGKQPITSALAACRRFSRKAITSLQVWLKELVPHAKDVVLVVEERAETMIPWEMIEVPTGDANAPQETPIAGLFKVVRWFTVGGSNASREIELHEHEHTGKLIGYAAPKLPYSGPPTTRRQKMRDLYQELDDSPKDLALVWIDAFGTQFKSVKEAQEIFGEDEEPFGPNDIEMLPTYGDAYRPVVCLNACFSACRSSEATLVEGFLGRVARGFLGTLGPIDRKIAEKIGADLMQQMSAGTPLLDALTAIRMQAAAKYVPGAGAIDLECYVHTCLFAYFGPPRLKLVIK